MTFRILGRVILIIAGMILIFKAFKLSQLILELLDSKLIDYLFNQNSKSGISRSIKLAQGFQTQSDKFLLNLRKYPIMLLVSPGLIACHLSPQSHFKYKLLYYIFHSTDIIVEPPTL